MWTSFNETIIRIDVQHTLIVGSKRARDEDRRYEVTAVSMDWVERQFVHFSSSYSVLLGSILIYSTLCFYYTLWPQNENAQMMKRMQGVEMNVISWAIPSCD